MLMKTLTLLVLAVTLIASAGGGRAQSPKSAPEAAPVVVQEIDVERMKQLIAERGGDPARPLLVNFWATWCEPCRAEFPDLIEIDRDYRQRGLDLIAISLDDIADLKTTVPRFLNEMRASGLTIYLLNVSDPGTAVMALDPEWGGALPATFLFDREGKLVYKHTGRVKPAELRAAIELLVRTKPKAVR